METVNGGGERLAHNSAFFLHLREHSTCCILQRASSAVIDPIYVYRLDAAAEQQPVDLLLFLILFFVFDIGPSRGYAM